MSGNNTNARPTCTWVPVTDASGRTYLEARWAPVGQAQQHQAA